MKDSNKEVTEMIKLNRNSSAAIAAHHTESPNYRRLLIEGGGTG